MMTEEELQLQIAMQASTIAEIQRRLRNAHTSPVRREQLENELLDRVHLRFVMIHALSLMAQ